MTLRRTIKSVVAAFIGVQSNKEQQQDFKKIKLPQLIFMAIIAVMLFITTLVFIVNWVS